MKIIQIVNVRWYNATAWYAIYLSKLLKDAGHEVLLVVLPESAPESKALELKLPTLHLDLNTSNPLRLVKTLRTMRHLLQDFAPDIINCHRGEGFFLWGILKLFGAKFKLIRTRGDQRLPKADFFNRFLHHTIASAVVLTNQKMARYFLSTMKMPKKGVWLIHGGVDTTRFAFDAEGRKKVRAEFGFKPEHIVIGLLGRFDRVKGQKELIEAVGVLKKQGLDNIRLFLIGFETATSLRQIQDWIKENQIADITQISQKREDVVACISALDVGVVASLWSEAIARAALEIMACERALISTDVNIMPDLLPQEALYPATQPQMLVPLLKRVSTDEAFRSNLVQAHKTTMSQLSGQDFLSRTLNMYQRLLED